MRRLRPPDLLAKAILVFLIVSVADVAMASDGAALPDTRWEAPNLKKTLRHREPFAHRTANEIWRF